MATEFDRVLVTGGAGFIGSHIVDGLLGEDCKVWILDNLSTGSLHNLKGLKVDRRLHFRTGTITDFDTVRALARKVEAIIHLAAVVSPQLSMNNPEITNRVNATGTLNVLEAARMEGIERLVFASSCAVYGNARALPTPETAPLQPITPYAVSKLAAEQYCLSYHRSYGLKTVALRYFNVYGERQSSNPYSGVIAIFARQLSKNRRPKIYGDGEQTRDFIHVSDIVRASLSALTTSTGIGKVYNIGTGKTTTISQLAQLMTTLLGKHALTPIYASSRKGDIRNSCANVLKARRELGFKAKVELRDGLTQLLRTL